MLQVFTCSPVASCSSVPVHKLLLTSSCFFQISSLPVFNSFMPADVIIPPVLSVLAYSFIYCLQVSYTHFKSKHLNIMTTAFSLAMLLGSPDSSFCLSFAPSDYLFLCFVFLWLKRLHASILAWPASTFHYNAAILSLPLHSTVVQVSAMHI